MSAPLNIQENKMTYELKSPILGFEYMNEVSFEQVDEMFCKVRSLENPAIELTLANPYLMREYSFDVPNYISLLLDIKDNSKVNVYCVVVLQTPLEKSKVNFLAPIIFNEDNKKAAQIALSVREYPHFHVADEIRNYMKEAV